MTSEYSQDDLLQLSGIQHFLFCRRQWALIHIEQMWKENALTTEGRIMHTRADDPFFSESRNGVITARSLPIASYHLGLVGLCDVVEFQPSADGVILPKHSGVFQPIPVEYKRGKEKYDHSDESQLCAQAICLEEMLSTQITHGYLYYGQTRHRSEIEFTPGLRKLVEDMSAEMHAYFKRGYTPKVKPHKGCRSCSLADLCLPQLQEKVIPASKYIEQNIHQ